MGVNFGEENGWEVRRRGVIWEVKWVLLLMERRGRGQEARRMYEKDGKCWCCCYSNGMRTREDHLDTQWIHLLQHNSVFMQGRGNSHRISILRKWEWSTNWVYGTFCKWWNESLPMVYHIFPNLYKQQIYLHIIIRFDLRCFCAKKLKNLMRENRKFIMIRKNCYTVLVSKIIEIVLNGLLRIFFPRAVLVFGNKWFDSGELWIWIWIHTDFIYIFSYVNSGSEIWVAVSVELYTNDDDDDINMNEIYLYVWYAVNLMVWVWWV